MGFRSLFVPITVLAAFGGGIAFLVLAEPPVVPASGPEAESPQPSAPRPTAPTPAVRLDPAPGQQGAAPLPDDIRDVSPEGVTAPQVAGKLTRIAPSERYLELMNPPIQPLPDGPLELRRAEVLDAGHLRSDRLTVKLAHISPPTLEETCKTLLGGSWPCGVRARTFLRGLVRRLKVSCEKIEDLGPHKVLATCTRGSIDLTTQLVRYGWSDVLDDATDDLKTLAAQARADRIGIWQADWSANIDTPEWANEDLPELPGLEELSPEIIDWSLRTGSDAVVDGPQGPDRQAEPFAPFPGDWSLAED